MMRTELDPTEALALAKGARERVAARAASPAWYAPLYGLFCGMLVAGGGTEQPIGMVLVALAIVMVGFLYQHWQRATGLNVNGYRKGTTRTIAIALAAALIGLMLAGLAVREHFGWGWAPLAAGGLAAIVAAFASAAWDRAWRAQMHGEVQ